MTNSERIAANNTRMSALVETAESLPDAGSGGGGGVETCTVTIIRTGNEGMEFPCVMYLIEGNGYAYDDIRNVGTYTIQCMKGTFLVIESANLSNVSAEAEIVTGSTTCVVLYIVDDCTITVTY